MILPKKLMEEFPEYTPPIDIKKNLAEFPEEFSKELLKKILRNLKHNFQKKTILEEFPNELIS